MRGRSWEAVHSPSPFDCADPHRQAAFWAAALDWQVEDDSNLIAGLQEAGHVSADEVIDAGRFLVQDRCRVRDPADPFDEHIGMGCGGLLLFQIVPESKTSKNRGHLDVGVGADSSADKIRQLTALGTEVIGKGDQVGRGWVILADREGIEFCIL